MHICGYWTLQQKIISIFTGHKKHVSVIYNERSSLCICLKHLNVFLIDCQSYFLPLNDLFEMLIHVLIRDLILGTAVMNICFRLTVSTLNLLWSSAGPEFNAYRIRMITKHRVNLIC